MSFLRYYMKYSVEATQKCNVQNVFSKDNNKGNGIETKPTIVSNKVTVYKKCTIFFLKCVSQSRVFCSYTFCQL